jgi:hypothetical protein
MDLQGQLINTPLASADVLPSDYASLNERNNYSQSSAQPR